MYEFPWAYQKIEPTTWAYVSSLLMLALFFKFSRIWSVRNLDLLLIILLAPGLLLYDYGTTMEREAVANIQQLGEEASLSLTSGGMLESPLSEFEDSLEEQPPVQLEESVPELPSETNESQDRSTGEPIPQSDPSETNLPAASDSGPIDAASSPANAAPNDELSEQELETEAEQNPSTAIANRIDQPEAGPQEPQTGDQAAEEETVDNSIQRTTVSEIDPLSTLEGKLERYRAQRSLSHVLLYTSFLFLLCVTALFVIRLLLDQVLVRRPLLENNMTVGGLSFLVASFLTFLVANISISSPMQTDLYGAKTAASALGDGEATDLGAGTQEMGPAYPLIHLLPVIPTVIRDTGVPSAANEEERSEIRSAGLVWVAKLMAILSQFAIVAGLIVLGRVHFNSMQNGVGMATLYLMLPYTAQMAGRVDHVLPGALLIWAAVLYRRPFWAGILFGMTLGLVYYPIFLLALWLSFYWEKGAARFIYGVSSIIGLLVLSLLFFSTEERGFLANLQSMFGVWLPRVSGLKGIWEFAWDPVFRLPVLVAYVSLCVSFVAWPIRKTYGTLLAYSAAMMAAVQFWHGYGGGLFMAWYLPLTIAAFFRPNVQERIAKYDVY